MKAQRFTLTDKEHERLSTLGDEFWTALGELAAKTIVQMPEDLQDLTTAYLQDRCSIYGTRYDELIKQARMVVALNRLEEKP